MKGIMKIGLKGVEWLFCGLCLCGIWVIPLIAVAQHHGKVSDDFEVLMAKIRRDSSVSSDLSLSLSLYESQIGSFRDIDYGNTQRTHWPPIQHLDRLWQWACAYTDVRHPCYGENALFEKIVKGLEFWQERNPECSNWWYNQIAEPKRMGLLLI